MAIKKGKPGEGYTTRNGPEIRVSLDLVRGSTPVRNRTAEKSAQRSADQPAGTSKQAKK